MAKKDKACTICGRAMWNSRDLADRPMCRPCRRARQVVRPAVVDCGHCGESFDRQGTRRAYCSSACQSKAEKQRARSQARECGWCGKVTIGERRSDKQAACSRQCITALALYARGLTTSPWHVGIVAAWTIKQRRQARINVTRTGAISRRYIYERDKWTCHLCGTKVDRSKQAPHPLAPTLDHIVPLARGGAHAHDNLALAHFQCNAVKGDRGGGEQLLLVG